MWKTYNVDEVGKYGVIYCLTSPSGKCYIGQSWNVKERWKVYKRIKGIKQQVKLYNALLKYGPDNFIFDIIDLCETQIEMDNKEIFYMDIYMTV